MTFTHPDLFNNMRLFFDRRITVQSQTQTVNAFGEVASTWADRTDLQRVRARISALREEQRVSAERSGHVVTDQVLISGYHSAIVLNDRIRDDDSTSIFFDIRMIDHDSDKRMTKLMVRRVSSPGTT